ncbi:ComEC/Rec2 family competence protein [Tropicimonas sp. TH_r6]|uniref:ComEC/Rec2 family competence protein n=1 Tax=Tropicimonas sp. TH_r6 TaxID=3082085 RepID=UPI0029556D13|nr:ComEC/Rec2 family competence protein [Tropicimonas sp. TH_r6]MDV7141901.1 ComEC/Rec2 family competence protein [Tropicimonas sp. TH_r6]
MYADPLDAAVPSRKVTLPGPLRAALLAQRGHLLSWVPISLALGIGVWFSLPVEPGAAYYAACGTSALVLAALGLRAGEAVAPLLWMMVMVLCGAMLAGARAHSVAEPVLGFRYYGAIQGRVVDIDRSSSDKMRLTLDRVVLEDMRPERTPARVRVSLHGDQGYTRPEPGLTVILSGHLSPPNGPVEPGGFDFRRMAWFQGLGAVGYTRTPVLTLARAEEGQTGLAIFRVRVALSQWVRDRVPGRAGAFAAAILTGDRSAMPREAVEALRNSNLAHLLAISGLHMGLLTGSVFAFLRGAMALMPWFALRYPIKKFAATGALLVGAGYLALSGGAVSTERAFIMVSVMLCAVLLERRAISLRSVAVAATIILLRAPEALFSAGFQMSFAATTGLVAAFGLIRDNRDRLPRPPRWLGPVIAVVISSVVAGAATAPFGAAHFNRIADYGLIANLLSVPLMGALVMPAAVAAAVLWPLGLSFLPLWVMRWGLEWILLVAETVAGLDGAVTHVVAPGPLVLPLLSFGFLFLICWQGRGRLFGTPLMLAALLLWSQAERPPILIAQSGGLVGVLGPEGRALSKPRGDGFAADNWLENDGDGADQESAAARPGFDGPKGQRSAQSGEVTLRHLTGKKGAESFDGTCRADVIIANKELPPSACQTFDLLTLRRTGSVAIWNEAVPPRIVTSAEIAGDRLWTR